MGYFVNGFVFSQSVDWSRLTALLPDDIEIRAYRHTSEAVWLLDLWRRSKYSHFALTDPVPHDLRLLSPSTPLAPQGLVDFKSLMAALPAAEDPYGGDWLELLFEVAAHADARCCFFAGDDSTVDFAAVAEPGRLRALRMRLASASIRFDDGRWLITPMGNSLDPEGAIPALEYSSIAKLPFASVEQPDDFDGSLQLHGAAVELWPVGDAAQDFGIGTWDCFDPRVRSVVVEFERVKGPIPRHTHSSSPNGSTAAPSRPWWKFWA